MIRRLLTMIGGLALLGSGECLPMAHATVAAHSPVRGGGVRLGHPDSGHGQH